MLKRAMFIVLAASMMIAPAVAQSRRAPPIPVRMVFERGPAGDVATLNVSFTNVGRDVMCVSPDYAGPARVVMTHERGQTAAQGSDAPATAGCIELAPGASLSAAYDVAALFPGQSLAAPRLCYTLPTRGGGADAGGELSSFLLSCSQARPQ